jgi:homoserine O-succinyltransferase
VAGVPRGERIRARIAAEYRPLDDITSDPPDLLVVTGANPIESRIEDELYWSDLHGLLKWGSENVPAMVLSCLSAHAALAVFDGVERTTLPVKFTGVFAQQADPTHPLAAGFDGPVVLPHSRLNAVPAEAVVAAGYAVALQSEEVGWSVATRRVGRSEVVLVQCHPEYDPSSLVREYHRDVRRYAGHERDELPCLPRDCVAGSDWDGLRRLHERVVGGERDPDLVAAFPFDEVCARAPWPWRGAALRLYANLLGTIPNRLLGTIQKRSA